ncbi:signal peptide-containing protein [Theileria equi strain WA]|uniref:Signal peptide-containing protein n=1 Tax=Theileria equi strain WA TaxID=1537102 RepID=L0B1A9_THEEQ|nr:signal peptide-containing protein [Theileria equi strain WA]AFZ81031.1 signal peptide-containing protein [Theileria equi strain WA]|eukprot:XP_004830697.1 signal peptide-containing protein [Theileria equi strain WA]
MRVILLIYLGFLLRLCYCGPPGPKKGVPLFQISLGDDEDTENEVLTEPVQMPPKGIADISLALKEAGEKAKKTRDVATSPTKQVWDLFSSESDSSSGASGKSSPSSGGRRKSDSPKSQTPADTARKKTAEIPLVESTDAQGSKDKNQSSSQDKAKRGSKTKTTADVAKKKTAEIPLAESNDAQGSNDKDPSSSKDKTRKDSKDKAPADVAKQKVAEIPLVNKEAGEKAKKTRDVATSPTKQVWDLFSGESDSSSGASGKSSPSSGGRRKSDSPKSQTPADTARKKTAEIPLVESTDAQGSKDKNQSSSRDKIRKDSKGRAPPKPTEKSRPSTSSHSLPKSSFSKLFGKLTSKTGSGTPSSIRFLEDEMQRPKSISGQLILDIASPNPSSCSIHSHDYDHISSQTIIPSSTVNLTKLVSNQKTIWEAKDGERCRSFRVYFRKADPVAVKLDRIASNRADDLILQLKDGKWKKVDEISVGDLARLMKKVPQRIDFTLDLARNKRTKHYDVIHHPKGSGFADVYYPKAGHHATEIRHSGTLIWLATGERTCTCCRLLYGNPLILCLEIRDGKDLFTLFFEQRGSTWDSVDKQYFAISS